MQSYLDLPGIRISPRLVMFDPGPRNQMPRIRGKVACDVSLRCPLNLMVEKVVHDSNVVDQIQDQRLEFHLLQILIKLKGSEIRQLLL